MCTATDWVGYLPTPGRFLYVSCEDELDELTRRRDCILQARGLKAEDLKGFAVVDLTSADDTEMARPEKDRLTLTNVFKAFEATIKEFKPKVALLDTRADVFGGSEINRVQVRTFVRSLRRLCLAHDMSIILVSHPSLTGISSGSGQSGSTGWGNSVRSRLYLTAPKMTKGTLTRKSASCLIKSQLRASWDRN